MSSTPKPPGDGSSGSKKGAATVAVAEPGPNVRKAENLVGLKPPPYEFLDEGATVEVRVRLPEGFEAEINGRRQVAVNAHDDSLILSLSTEAKILPLLVASPLYSRIIPGGTVWYLDEGELVVSLQKANAAAVWPALVQEMAALGRGVGKLLKSCSVNLVGRSAGVNWAVARELALAVGYVPLSTRSLVEGLTKVPLGEYVQAEGMTAASELEEEVVKSLTTTVRCVVATMGEPLGVGGASEGAMWRSLHSGVTVWLDTPSSSGSRDAEGAAPDVAGSIDAASEDSVKQAQAGGALHSADSCYQSADARVVLDGECEEGEESARLATEGVLRALKNLLEAEPKLPDKKSLYLRLGCRGDWPDIQSPDYNPDMA
eukprot:TRINITY_DN8739_c0_g1_i2.p1 TRINITY_DN8739_c0_g1~~TRINITY_DN8739_c0_g1_i2.p1  ORF type:complete len:373 (+),score=81.44 TRINITY_DN8739_c0_g1_i2:283-1401(+)